DVDVDRDFGSDESDGGKLKPQLVIQNSYNGSTGIDILFGFFRGICSNMLVFPVEGQVIKCSHRHKNVSDKLQPMIHGFLRDALNDKMFDHYRDMIQSAKAKTEEKEIDFKWLTKLPANQLFPVLAAITRYSQIGVTSVNGDNRYDLTNVVEAYSLAEKVSLDRGVKFDPYKKWQKAMSETNGYLEAVQNHFQLFQLLLKVRQVKVNQNRRIQVAADTGKYFL
ncbi:MAG: DUF932 domain-containing protein, partial [bacterium]|nr:DUF932 domain-containing protein [bacterium]